MRLLCELAIIGALIYIGWEKPFRQWLPNSEPAPTPAVAVAPRPRPLPTQPAWMHDPNHRTPLDTPHPSAAPASTAKGGSWLFDPNHRSPLDPPAHASASPH